MLKLMVTLSVVILLIWKLIPSQVITLVNPAHSVATAGVQKSKQQNTPDVGAELRLFPESTKLLIVPTFNDFNSAQSYFDKAYNRAQGLPITNLLHYSTTGTASFDDTSPSIYPIQSTEFQATIDVVNKYMSSFWRAEKLTAKYKPAYTTEACVTHEVTCIEQNYTVVRARIAELAADLLVSLNAEQTADMLSLLLVHEAHATRGFGLLSMEYQLTEATDTVDGLTWHMELFSPSGKSFHGMGSGYATASEIPPSLQALFALDDPK